MDEQRVAVVVGAASGIGWATARLLAGSGYAVTLADLDGDAAGSRAAELGEPHLGVRVDVADEDSVVALFDAVTSRFGAFQGVVNCAGVSTLSAITEHDVAEFRRVVDVCLTGSFLVLKHAGRHVADGGSVVSLASLNARQPGTGLAAYCAAKAGLVSLTEVAALELAPRRVRVNAVAPGLVVTPLTAPAMDIPGVRDAYLENTPLGRSGEPEEVAAAVRFLLSDDAAWMTGETMDLNGGAHLQRYPDLLGLVTKAFA
ncbi:MAG TPA: SDR family NAD(P)-dependent oxidoreductase [Marmoricola sp.]|nr:SDR family NAD(P)-dependent oxidoreductase [Marmoricola sp.]